jgi:hypothetical protein
MSFCEVGRGDGGLDLTWADGIYGMRRRIG